MRHLIFVVLLVLFSKSEILNAQNIWSPLGTGLTISDRVIDITYNPNTGEYFIVTDFNGTSSDVYKLSNNVWTQIASVGNSNGSFANIEYYNGSIYVGCVEMVTLNGNTINSIARYDGVNWNAVGSGFTKQFSNAQIRDMRVWKNMLIITGQFDNANGVSTTNIAVVSDTTLGAAPFNTSQMNLGNEIPNRIGEYNGDLILGISPNNINIFSIDSNNYSVTQIGSFNSVGIIYAFDEFNGELYATGQFSFLGTTGIVKWNGINWAPVNGPTIQVYGNSVDHLGNELFVSADSIWEDYTGTPIVLIPTNQTSSLITTLSKKINGCLFFLGNFDTFNSIPAIGVIRVCPNLQPASSLTANDSTICSGACVNFSNQSINDSSWQWSFPGGTPASSTLQNPPQVCYATSGSYSVTLITSNNFGIDTLTLPNYITVYPAPSAQANSNSPICVGDTLLLYASTSTTYSWNGPNGFISNLQNPIVPNSVLSNSGAYTLIVTNNNGCTDTISIPIIINPNTSVIANSNSPVCEGLVLNLFVSQGLDYTWTGPNGFTSNLQNPIINDIVLSDSGIYSVAVDNGCGISNASFQVIVNQTPTAEIVADKELICEGEAVLLNASGGTSYLWFGPNNFNSTFQSLSINNFSSLNSGLYSVIATNSVGCTDSSSINLALNQSSCFFIPSVFTPNSDGINDQWIIEGIWQFPSCKVRVLNRWGQELFQSNGYANPWDGKFDGENCPIADYYYIIDLRNGSKVYTGTVTIKY